MTYKMSSSPFPLHPSTRHGGLSPKDLCSSVSSHRFPQCVCFSEPGQQQALSFPLCTKFYEQTSSHTSWLKAFFLLTFLLVA